ncbi:MAG: S1C family serine protease [Akkermansiaceae bacterium]|nr:S1C family serine protease [Akkermansiaceae bacterium]MCF7733859.1 S1C family serine protease [Akkermansiaceae bacterium]
MKLLTTCLLAAALPWIPPPAEAARPYINDKQAPENRKDLEAIQTALTSVLDQARAATVCIDLGQGSGSGVIVSEDGLVLTAAHVATGVNKDLEVILEDGRRLKAVSLGVVADCDAAMIQISAKEKFPFVTVDREDSTRLGDWVFSLGHSGGFDKERGSVVRLGRLVRLAETTVQSDCTLIGGDSGGPLFDLQGRLIGIHSRVGQQLQMNMHVPMSVYVQNWDSMLKSEFVGEGPFAQKPEKGKGFLGLASEKHPDGGIKVTKVGKDTPAEQAGLKEGDILLKLNGTALETRAQLQDLLKEMAAGDPLEFHATRDGKPKTFKFKLGAR